MPKVKHDEYLREDGKIIKTAKARSSKFTSINFLTIPQIKAAKDVLNKKLGETGNSPAVQAKLTELLDEYERSEAEIRKWHRNYYNNPKTKEIVKAKGTLAQLTIAKINGKNVGEKEYNGKDKHIKYGMRDKLRNTNLDKWALGIGVTALGLGAAGQITSAVAGKSLMQLLKIAIEAMWKNNPAALVALLGGAGLIAASKIVPAIDRSATRTARRIREDRMKVNAANNLAYAGAEPEEGKEEKASEASTPAGKGESAAATREEAEAGGTGSATTELEEEKENIDGTSGTETDTKPKDEQEQEGQEEVEEQEEHNKQDEQEEKQEQEEQGEQQEQEEPDKNKKEEPKENEESVQPSQSGQSEQPTQLENSTQQNQSTQQVQPTQQNQSTQQVQPTQQMQQDQSTNKVNDGGTIGVGGDTRPKDEQNKQKDENNKELPIENEKPSAEKKAKRYRTADEIIAERTIEENIEDFIRSVIKLNNDKEIQQNHSTKNILNISDDEWSKAIRNAVDNGKTKLTETQVRKLCYAIRNYMKTMTLSEAREITAGTGERVMKTRTTAMAKNISNLEKSQIDETTTKKNKERQEIYNNSRLPIENDVEKIIGNVDLLIAQVMALKNYKLQTEKGNSQIDLVTNGTSFKWKTEFEEAFKFYLGNSNIDPKISKQASEIIRKRLDTMSLQEAKNVNKLSHLYNYKNLATTESSTTMSNINIDYEKYNQLSEEDKKAIYPMLPQEVQKKIDLQNKKQNQLPQAKINLLPEHAESSLE